MKQLAENTLLRGYALDPAVLTLKAMRTVRKPCMCRGFVEADPTEPMPGVMEHNAGPAHQAWRKARR